MSDGTAEAVGWVLILFSFFFYFLGRAHGKLKVLEQKSPEGSTK